MAAMENSRMKLSYFDARGVAETTRYMLAVTKTPYEDFRYATLTPSSRLTVSSVVGTGSRLERRATSAPCSAPNSTLQKQRAS